MRLISIMAVCATLALAGSAAAQTPRDTLTQAAFVTRDKAAAIAQVNQARAQATAALKRAPSDREAQFQAAMATGYVAKLTRSRGDAVAARQAFETLVANNPRDAEARLALAGWHLDCIADVGAMLAGAALGAKKATGLEALDRAVALGGKRAFFPGIASLMRIRLNPRDVAASLALAEAAVASPAPTRLDQIAKRQATALLAPLRANDGKAAAALAVRLLPFGQLSK